jgi:hypothetical protein
MKVIKIMFKAALGLIFVLGGGGSSFFVVSPTAFIPSDIMEGAAIRKRLYEMMLNPAYKDDDITRFIPDFKQYLTNMSLCGDNRELWEPERQYLLNYSDLVLTNVPCHRAIRNLMTNISRSLKYKQPCYSELRIFTEYAVKYPFYTEDAKKFNASLVSQAMDRIEYMMTDQEVAKRERTDAIYDLIHFINHQKDCLPYNGEAELGKLNDMFSRLDSYRKMRAQRDELNRLITNQKNLATKAAITIFVTENGFCSFAPNLI